MPKETSRSEESKQPRWSAKRVHPTWSLVADECPNCQFPEAEGGYCPNCGWSLPHPLGEGHH